jgi:L-2-hydroxyglutarate oxidase
VGKVIVATAEEEAEELRELQGRAEANGVPDVEWLDPAGLAAYEPYATGTSALRVPGTASVDFGAIARAMARRIEVGGGVMRTAAPVIGIGHGGDRIVVETTSGEWDVGVLVNAAGLHADRVAAMAGLSPEVRIVPFRGEYYRVRPGRTGLVNGMIYPVPDPRFPFLGTHFTRTVRDEVEVGPNAVPALAREGYSWGLVRPQELWHSWGHLGSVRLAGRHWWTGLGEIYRSVSMRGFVRRLQRLVPEVSQDDLEPAGSGVRAQAVDSRGRLMDDFVIERQDRMLHVLNAPSPAATAAFPIGDRLATQVLRIADR